VRRVPHGMGIYVFLAVELVIVGAFLYFEA
jgi:hypothetical protein